MTSDAITTTPVPPRRFCPACGTPIHDTGTVRCDVCNELLPTTAISAEYPEQNLRFPETPVPVGRPTWGDGTTMAEIGFVVLVGLCFLASLAPNYLLFLVVILMSALVRTRWEAIRKESGSNLWIVFFSSIGVASLAWLAAFVAFYATCSIAYIRLRATNLPRAHSDDLLLGFGAGLPVGVLVAIALFMLFWKKRR